MARKAMHAPTQKSRNVTTRQTHPAKASEEHNKNTPSAALSSIILYTQGTIVIGGRGHFYYTNLNFNII